MSENDFPIMKHTEIIIIVTRSSRSEWAERSRRGESAAQPHTRSVKLKEKIQTNIKKRNIADKFDKKQI